MKAVLPAILQTNAYLQRTYSNAIHKLNLTSKNFDDQMAWVQKQGNLYQNPYKLLPPLFEDWNENEFGILLSDINDIADGGAALTAYAKLQFTDMSDEERVTLNKGLLKYCELDTLAMVMVWEGLSALLD